MSLQRGTSGAGTIQDRTAACGRLSRFLALSSARRRLLFRAAANLLLVRALLALVSLRRVHSLLRISRVSSTDLPEGEAKGFAWAVSVAAGIVPGATCLPQALALQRMLAAAGSSSRIHVGFARHTANEVRGHAWLEWNERVLIGGGDLSAFETLMVLDD